MTVALCVMRPIAPSNTQSNRMLVTWQESRGFSDVGEAIEEATGGTGAATRSPSEQETLGGAARRPEVDDPGLAQPQRLRSEPSLGGGAEAARAAGLPSEIVDSGYVYTRHDLPDVVPEAVFAGARPPRQTPELADERTRGVAWRRPTTAPDPRDVQNATLNADLRLIEVVVGLQLVELGSVRVQLRGRELLLAPALLAVDLARSRLGRRRAVVSV